MEVKTSKIESIEINKTLRVLLVAICITFAFLTIACVVIGFLNKAGLVIAAILAICTAIFLGLLLCGAYAPIGKIVFEDHGSNARLFQRYYINR